MLIKAGRDIRVPDSFCLFGKDCIQSLRARVDWVCLQRNLDLEWAQGAFTLAQFGRPKDVRVVFKCRGKSINNTRVPARSVQYEIYAVDIGHRSV